MRMLAIAVIGLALLSSRAVAQQTVTPQQAYDAASSCLMRSQIDLRMFPDRSRGPELRDIWFAYWRDAGHRLGKSDQQQDSELIAMLNAEGASIQRIGSGYWVSHAMLAEQCRTARPLHIQ